MVDIYRNCNRLEKVAYICGLFIFVAAILTIITVGEYWDRFKEWIKRKGARR